MILMQIKWSFIGLSSTVFFTASFFSICLFQKTNTELSISELPKEEERRNNLPRNKRSIEIENDLYVIAVQLRTAYAIAFSVLI